MPKAQADRGCCAPAQLGRLRPSHGSPCVVYSTGHESAGEPVCLEVFRRQRAAAKGCPAALDAKLGLMHMARFPTGAAADGCLATLRGWLGNAPRGLPCSNVDKLPCAPACLPGASLQESASRGCSRSSDPCMLARLQPPKASARLYGLKSACKAGRPPISAALYSLRPPRRRGLPTTAKFPRLALLT